MTASNITSTENLFLTVLALMVIGIFGGAIYAFVISIFQFIFSKGDPEKVKKAWNNIRYMIIGIIFTIFLLIVFPMVFQRLEIPGYRVYSARNIFKKSGELIKLILNQGSTQTAGSDTLQYDVQEGTDSSTSSTQLHL